MAKYRPIDTRIWNDRKFLSLSQDSRMLWLFLLTSPFTLPIPGVILAGELAMSERLEWDVERYRERFAEIQRNGIAVRSEGRLIWLCNATKYQPPANPNVLTCWSKHWDDIPDCQLKSDIREALKIVSKRWSKIFDKLFAPPPLNGYANGLPNGFEYGLHTETGSETETETGSEEREPQPSAAVFSRLDLDSVSSSTNHTGHKRTRQPQPTLGEISIATRVLERLSEANGVQYSAHPKHVELISHRLREGIDEFELRAIVAYCASSRAVGGLGWSDDSNMRSHLRPETLFGRDSHARYLEPARTWMRSEIDAARAAARAKEAS